MALTTGARLGPYEIVSPIGVGGMGEVYKARDTRLDRTVAVKVLPEDLASDSTLRSRFEREARAIAALSHPHICTIHDVGRDGATDYLVMEYLDGQTLADRMTRAAAPLPIEQVLPIGIAIADALDKAHRAGIVHRDLKPANVMLTKTGPKLLDFGLAKAGIGRPGRAGAAGLAATTAPGADTTKALTGAHTVLGTIYYMAPEQVEGREADSRSDIWALGAVLYEMATGQRPFNGDSSASVIGAILKDTLPLVSVRQPLAPAAFDHLVDRCLQKDPDERWQDAGDVKRQLQWIANAGSSTNLAAPSSSPKRAAAGRWMTAAGVIVGIAFGGGAVFFRPQPPVPIAPRTVLSIAPPEHIRLGGSFALSPDGRRFVFVGMSGDAAPTLWLRSLDSGTAVQLPGTEDAAYPFWSPQGDAIGFFASNSLKTMAITGSVPRTIVTGLNLRGGSWGTDGTILYGGQNIPIQRVSDRGGASTPVTALDAQHRQLGHRWPTFVDARHFVYAIQGVGDATGLVLASLDDPTSLRLAGVYSNSLFVDGRLLFVSDGALVGQTLDVRSGRLLGTPEVIVGPLAYTPGLGYAPISVSSTGALAYTAGSGSATPSELVWFDRQGKRLGSLGADTGVSRDVSYNERLSPDGRTLVLTTFRKATADLWLVALAREVGSRFTFDDANEQFPVFSPDGDEVVFASNRDGIYNLYRKRVNGSSQEARLFASATPHQPTDWSAHGPTLFFTNMDPRTKADLWTVSTTGEGTPAPLLTTSFNEYSARLSPDGHWLAFTSDESGKPEVYVQKFPVSAGKVQISTQGGSEPAWRGDGRELFYIAANQTLTAVTVATAPDFSAGRPTKLFDAVIDTSLGNIHSTHYTPTADGQRFLASISVTSATPPTVVLNWTSALKP